MRASVRRAPSTAWGCLLCLGLWHPASDASAHGGPPEIYGIAAADTEGVSAVVLNEGLAVKHQERWVYLCPSLWEDRQTTGTRQTLAYSIDGQTTWVVGADDIYALREGGVQPQGRDMLGAANVLSLAVTREHLYGLVFSEQGSEVVPIDRQAAPLYGSAEQFQTLATHEEAMVVGRIEDRELVLLELDERGTEGERHELTLEAPGANLRLRLYRQALFVVWFDGNEHVLARLDLAENEPVLTELSRSVDTIQGPQHTPGGTAFITHGKALLRLTEDGDAEPVDTPEEITCLNLYGSLPYACAGSRLYELTNEGLGEILLDLTGLHSQPPELIPESAEPECGFQWQLFRNDLQRSGLAPQDWPEEGAPDGGVDAGPSAAGPSDTQCGGCRLSAPDQGLPGLVLVLWLGLRHTRRRG